jgi:drug/metabolite transporter (DMT)-like permease
VGQLQLLQPFLTLLFAALLVRERLDWMTAAFALAVGACLAIGRRMPMRRKAERAEPWNIVRPRGDT